MEWMEATRREGLTLKQFNGETKDAIAGSSLSNSGLAAAVALNYDPRYPQQNIKIR